MLPIATSAPRAGKVWDWLPIHDWTEVRVWNDIKDSRVRYHEAYDYGMPRLSCAFCIFAPRAALVLAGRHNPELLDEYVRVESRIGYRFRMDVSMSEVKAEIARNEAIGAISGEWNM